MTGAGDPLAGLPRPPGDPGVATGAGRKYTAAATQLDTSAQQVLKAVHGVVGSDWLGAGAASAARCTVALAAVFSQAATAAQSGGASLSTFGAALTQAQSLWDRARAMADQAMADEASYRSNAETQAQQLDKQAATGNIGAAHAAASVREDAATYTSPLRGRAVAMATGAEQDAKTAAATAAGRLGSATSAMTAVPPAPTPTRGGDGGGDSDNIFQWFNDMVLGSANTGASLLTLPPALYGGARLAAAARSSATLASDLDTAWGQYVAPFVQQFLRGELPASELATKLNTFDSASVLMQADSESRLSKASSLFGRGGLPDNGIVDAGSKFLGGLALVGDVGTMISPGGSNATEDTVNRGASVLNAGSTLVVLNAAGDEVPVAGEVIMVGSGLYLGGDWLYHHWTPFHNAMDDAGDTISSGWSWTTHAAGTVAHDLNPLNWSL